MADAYRKLPELNAWTKQRPETALEPELPIIDSHHHFWDDEHRGRYLFDDLLEDIGTGHNIVATVFLPTAVMHRAEGPKEMQSVGEVEFVNGIAAMSASGRYGSPRVCAGIVGRADLTLGDRVQPVLEALIAAGNGRLRGIRYSLGWDSGNLKAQRAEGEPKVPRHLALDPTFRKGYARLQPLGLSFDASFLYPQLSDLSDLLRAFPDTTTILDHIGGLIGVAPHDNRDEVFAVWRNHIRELAQFPNLSVKLGGLGSLRCGWDFYLRDAAPSSHELAVAWRPYVETCIEAFGVDRCMMESNFPPDKQSCGYGVLWNAMKRITQGCSPEDKAALYHGTAARIYRLAVRDAGIITDGFLAPQ